MIRIHRPAQSPPILRKRGRTETNTLCVQYDANRTGYDNGTKKFPTADRTIYGAKSIKNALKICQGNKCCYSEAKLVRDSVAVEHFRPKGAIGIRGSKNKDYPGYYWLAYEWTNLLLVKHGVNSDKKDYFPLVGVNRANNHQGDISLEQPVIIDPASEDEDPRDHIRFHNDAPEGITDRGKYTVDLLLLHEDLVEDRRTHFKQLSLLKEALQALESSGDDNEALISKIQAELHAAIQPDAIYSSMAIDLLTEGDAE